MKRENVYSAIDSERDFQDARWGTVEQHPHEVGSWILIMEKLLADAREAWAGNAGDAKALDEIRKVAAVAVACGEQHGLPSRGMVSTLRPSSQPNPYRKDGYVRAKEDR